MDTEKKYDQEELDKIVAISPYYKATSNDIDWLSKVRLQGAVQKWVDHSISVTINLPNEVSEDMVPIKDQGFVVFHDAYQYFEKRFGLSAIGSVTVSPEVMPGAERISDLQTKINEEHI